MTVAEREGIITGRIVLQEGALPNAFTYTGRHWDPVARLYHYRARAYDPDTGSFLQHDPIPADNPYAYTDNNPLNFTDPLGLTKSTSQTITSKLGYVCSIYERTDCDMKCRQDLNKLCERMQSMFVSGSGSPETTGKGFAKCTKCESMSKIKTCEEYCSKYPSSNCLNICKEGQNLRAQDNPNGDGKNKKDSDGEPGVDVGIAPEDSSSPPGTSMEEQEETKPEIKVFLL